MKDKVVSTTGGFLLGWGISAVLQADPGNSCLFTIGISLICMGISGAISESGKVGK